MELMRFGFDTVRLAVELDTQLPMESPEYRHDLAAAGWSVNVRSEKNADGDVFEGRTGFWQDEGNSTIRGQIHNAGRVLVSEFSVPRVLANSPLNLELATWEQVQDVSQQVLARIYEHLPVAGIQHYRAGFGEIRWRRADLAADVAAGEARPGLIAAAGRFLMPGTRKPVKQVFPGETGRVSSPSMTFRGYDKARELCNKTDALLLAMEPEQRLKTTQQIEALRVRGSVRLELALTPKKGGLSEDDMSNSNIKWSDVVERGFSGGQIYIGGLARIRQQIDARRATYATETMMAKGEEKRFRWKVDGEFSPQTANALLAFAVRYAELGESGMLQIMSRPTYYRHRKAFLAAGLSLDDLCTYEGEIDLRPVLKTVRGA